MSAHAEIVRDYVALRNHLAKSNPKPNMEFEVHFKVEGLLLFALNSKTNAKVGVAKINPITLYLSNLDQSEPFEAHTKNLIKYINSKANLRKSVDWKIGIRTLAGAHKASLDLQKGYEP